MLIDSCRLLDLSTAPDLYIRQSPYPNAYTLAVQGRRPFVVCTTALLDLLDPLETQVRWGSRRPHNPHNSICKQTQPTTHSASFHTLIPTHARPPPPTPSSSVSSVSSVYIRLHPSHHHPTRLSHAGRHCT